MLAPRGPASRRWWCQGSQSSVEGDLISQTTGDTSTPPTTYTYSRGLLQSSTTGGQTSTYNYDPLGRLDTITGPGGTIEQSDTYDGFDNLASTTQGSGSSAVTTSYAYDPLNRVTSQTTGTSTTSYAYLGLTRQVSSETDPGSITKTYGYTPDGTRLFQTTAGNTATPSLNGTAYYSYDNNNNVEALTGPSGTPTATYGYTAYGSPVTAMFTGADKNNANPGPNVVPYNSYRFNAMPWDPGSGQYNMDARNYDPGLGSFDTRDIYAVSGGTHAFASAKPASNKDQAGHSNLNKELQALRDFAASNAIPALGRAIQAGARAAETLKIDKASNAANNLAFETIRIPYVDVGTAIAAGFFQAWKGIHSRGELGQCRRASPFWVWRASICVVRAGVAAFARVRRARA